MYPTPGPKCLLVKKKKENMVRYFLSGLAYLNQSRNTNGKPTM
jgi:hypothetical protein